MIQSGLLDFSLKTEEFGILMESKAYSADEFKLHLPRLMPLINASSARTRNSFDRNIFVNASACKPSVSTSVTTQGFLTVTKSRTISLIYMAGSNGAIAQGTKFMCKVMGKNIDQMYIAD